LKEEIQMRMTKQIYSYSIEVKANTEPGKSHSAIIEIFDKKDWIGRIYFFDIQGALPQAHIWKKDGKKLISLAYPLNLFNSIVEIFRNEKNIYLDYIGEIETGTGFIRCGNLRSILPLAHEAEPIEATFNK
jgi:hypothetical protein